MTPTQVYETLVGADSNMGVGDWKDKLDNLFGKVVDRDDHEVTLEDVEELLREVSNEIADEDEFEPNTEDNNEAPYDGDPAAEEGEDDGEGLEEGEEGPVLLEGERIETLDEDEL